MMERRFAWTTTRRAAMALLGGTGASALSGVTAGRSWRGGDQAAAAPMSQSFPGSELEEVTLANLRVMLDARQLSARELVDFYLARIDAIDQNGPRLRAVIEVNPDAQAIADALDRELGAGQARGPLHGIPILVKDNIDTADQMLTTAGSLALTNSRPRRDAFVVERLRAAGAVILGKANLSEWANFRGYFSTSGWSARGGQNLNPYVLGTTPCGSSSGSAVAAAANLCAAAVGTETDGSILCPAATTGVVGLKPTVGLTSRAGVIPISHSQDSVGPLARTVADAAVLLAAMAGPDPRDPAATPTAGAATPTLGPDGLRGARIGVPRDPYWRVGSEAIAIADAALELLAALGAEIVDPADIPTAYELREEPGELTVLLYEFKDGIDRYLAERGDPEFQTLADLIRFNEEHATAEMRYFGQEYFVLAQEREPDAEAVYREALTRLRRQSREEGIDAVMDQHRLDALVAPSGYPAPKIDLVNGDGRLGGLIDQPAAVAGSPAIPVPAGCAFGRPGGITFVGRAHGEPTLIRLAAAFEEATRVRRPPRYVTEIGEPPVELGEVVRPTLVTATVNGAPGATPSAGMGTPTAVPAT